MAWVAIGAAAVGVVGSAVVSNQNNKAADARAANASAGASQNPVTAADPFADQRFQYQNQLMALMETGKGQQGDATAQSIMKNFGIYGGSNNTNQSLDKLNAMISGGGFTPDDPSYKFRLDQGNENLLRTSGASGMLDSGNRLAELQKYGQGMASQEFQNQFARTQAAVGTNMNHDQQQFSNLQAVDSNAQTIFSNNYSRLAQLAGANTGSPGGAGQLMAGQQAGAAAQTQKYGDLAIKAGGKLWDWAMSDSSGNKPDNGYGSTGSYDYTPTALDTNPGGALTDINW